MILKFQKVAIALKGVGEDNAAVFEVHKMMMEDKDYLESTHSMVREQKVICRGNDRG